MRRTPVVHAAAAAAFLLLLAAACAPRASAASAPVLLPAGAEQGRGVWSYSGRPQERQLGSDEYEDEDGGRGLHSFTLELSLSNSRTHS
jgi:hypothetical protein